MIEFIHRPLTGFGVLLILLTTSFIRVFSQDFVHFTQDNGLPSNKVYMMTMDKNGFIWCATDKGIAMYNGDRFTTYTVQNGLPLNDLWKIYASPEGKIWYFGRSNRLGYIENGIVYSFPSNTGATMNPTAFIFYENLVGISSAEEAFYLINDVWTLSHLTKEKSYELRNDKDKKKAVFFYGNLKSNTLIVITENKLIHCDSQLNTLSESFIPGEPINVSNYSPSSLFVDDEVFYFYIWDRLCIYYLRDHRIKTIMLKNYFTDEDIKRMYIFYENKHVILNGQAGKYTLINDSLVQSVKPIHFSPIGVNSFFLDSLGNTWVNTLNEGIFMYPSYNYTNSMFVGENVQKINRFKGELYVGVEDKGLFKINGTQEKIIPTKGKYFYSLQSNNDSTQLVLTEAEFGVYKNGILNQKILKDSLWSIPLKRKIYYHIFSFKCCFEDNGIMYRGHSALFFEQGRKKDNVYYISGVYNVIKYRGRILLGTTSGIKMLGNNNILDIAKNQPQKVNKMMGFRDYLLVGTDGEGLFVYKDSLIKVPGTESLVVNDIEVADSDAVWISTNLGVHEILYKNGLFVQNRSILRSHGLTSNVVNDIIISNDSLFCATENGLCFLPLKGLKLKGTPNIIFTKISVNDSIYKYTDTITIENKGSNSLEVGFDIAYLNEHNQLRNYYKIEPVHKEWLAINSPGFTIAGLKPGAYVVKIKTEGFNGNKNEKKFLLIIQPRWFEKSWVIFVAVVLGIGLVAFIGYLIASGILKRRNRKIQLENQLINLELYALRSKLNPHFIFNTFNSIQLYINSNQLELSEKYLVLLSKHIRNVFEFSHLQKISLEKEISLLKDYLEIEKTRFGEKIDIQINVDQKINTRSLQIPSMIIQPYVENSMVHGLFHKEGTGHLQVDFIYVNENTYQVRIVDDGIGFIQTESDRISSTKVNNDRIDLINQSGDFFITVNKSFLDESKKNKGTVITITINHGK